MSRRPVRVLLPNDRELVVHGLRSMLAPHRDRIEIVEAGEADSPADVEILDVPGAGTTEDIEALGRSHGGARRQVVLVDGEASPGFIQAALRRGAAGLLVLSEPAGVLADALVRAAEGAVVVSRSLEPSAAGAVQRWPGENRGLSRRESQVLVLIAAGRSPEEIVQTLGIAHETVRSHLKRVYHKLGARDRATAVAMAWNQGIVDRRTVADVAPVAVPVHAGNGH